MRRGMIETLQQMSVLDALALYPWRDYYELCKPRVVALIVFTAIVGMFLATDPPGLVPWSALLFGTIGITIWAVQMLWIPFWAAGVINGLGHWLGYRNFYAITRYNKSSFYAMAVYELGQVLSEHRALAQPGS